MDLSEFEIYNLSRELSKIAWEIFSGLNYSEKINIGNQFIRAFDSVGANIAEGLGRYYYMDSVKFYYYARGSLMESIHWTELLKERKLIDEILADDICKRLTLLRIKLNNSISTTKKMLLKLKKKQTLQPITIHNNT